MRRSPLLLLLPVLVLLAALAVWGLREARWRGPLYCIEQAGQVWGLAPVPAAATPTCPESRSYRQEVREGFARVEQYTLPGWHPRALLPAFQAAGFVPEGGVEDDGDEFAVFLGRAGERVQYVADRQPDGRTLITLSGRPR
ncbi:hypothetical protein E5F05_09540 [Deinococcus metallilatus]|uniref:Uncharacterized protein n=1 Tax=Deinococcus metallilatus TaxID=1211322 RepID=A0AAJ5F3V8_9DEIO|nr:hypothetical protein [Deinococcus metallilatus]MBB5296019.1 hypothetical protein [Deinococcus metallilatus]QBY08162.1 hypothetical protein E5F05_09540 [Deinococcus metallilatus]RXJ11894.1 hypothetical protein ERJ73_08350 [Deinococcus metallilatus]TLK25874.1 hypothetical protein FCS05_12630 [Deinococcus metallilatus]GMA14446.1 hypothetical protein GCM10025871_07770 [Deinococcus metallilatus]